MTSAGKELIISYVSKTDVWERKFIAEPLKDQFMAAVEKHKDTFKPDTVEVAVK
jgi:hypothetical protein